MTNKFKVGDKVVRTKYLDQAPSNGWPSFVAGKVYTVTVTGKYGMVGLADMPRPERCPYDADCFELAYVPKIGDRVVTTESNPGLYSEGATGVVVKLDTDGTVKVKFVDGGFNTRFNATIGGIWVFTRNLKLAEAAYSSSFTKPTTPSTEAKGHVASGGGLQQHSVGGAYPWAVVAYDDKVHGTRYTVENLETGEVMSLRGLYGTEYPAGWYCAANATAYLETMRRSGSQLLVKGRPVFDGYRLVFAKPNKVQEAQDAMVAAVMAYHAALQSDIG